jgi:hypothetical protein
MQNALDRRLGWMFLIGALIDCLFGWWWLAGISAGISLMCLAEGYRVTSVLGLRLWWVKNDDA